jgi:hypothetical protein
VKVLRRVGRIEIRADDPSLTGHGGLVVIGDLAEKLDLIGLIDAEIARERRARPVKVRRGGCSPGELVVSIAECQLVGGAFFDHLADQRADTAGAQLRAVGEVPVSAGGVAERQTVPSCALPADRAGDGRRRPAA